MTIGRGRGLAQHEVAGELVGPHPVMIEGGQLELQHLESLQTVAAVKVLQILLLQQDELHLDVGRLVLEVHREVLEHVDRPRPVSLHDAVPEGGGRGLVQPAARLLHQNISGGPETNITQMLADQSYNLSDNHSLQYNFVLFSLSLSSLPPGLIWTGRLPS